MLITGLIFGYLVLSGQLRDAGSDLKSGSSWRPLIWVFVFIILYSVLSLLNQSKFTLLIQWVVVLIAFSATLIRLVQVILRRKGNI